MNRQKHLLKLCNSRNFTELYRIVELKLTKQGSHRKGTELAADDMKYLREFTLMNFSQLINSGEKIPEPLVKLSLLLGEEHITAIKIAVCNFVVSQKSADISQFIQRNFQTPDSLNKIFNFLEQMVGKITDHYSSIPSEWNLDLKLVHAFLIMAKQAICNYFFVSDVKSECYSSGLIHTINFEKKLDAFFVNKKCCISDQHGNAQIDCFHKKMLSNVFVPYANLFFENLLTKISQDEFKQNITEKSFIKVYIEFFKQLEHAYDIAIYLDDKGTYISLVSTVDRCLFTLIKKMKIEDKLSKMLPVISTILYIQHVMEEFLDDVSVRYAGEFRMVSIEASRKLERLQAIKLEREFNNNFSGNILDFEASYKKIVNSQGLASEEVKYYILELCMSQLFSKISSIKMNAQRSARLANEIYSLELSMKSQFETVPHLKAILNYLQIFMFPTDPSEDFVQNFNKISGGRFELIQILRSLEDQRQAMKIYEAFKKIKN